MSWIFDPSHTQIQFSVRHMMIARVHGTFDRFNGSILLDETNPATTTVQVEVETASINTREEKRDAHLRSADFFDSEKFPEMVFTSKRVDLLDEQHARLIGDLTIRGITREVALNVEYLGRVKSPWGQVSAGFAAHAKINRKDWNLTWNVALETGGVLVGDEIEIHIEAELIKQPEAEPLMSA